MMSLGLIIYVEKKRLTIIIIIIVIIVIVIITVITVIMGIHVKETWNHYWKIHHNNLLQKSINRASLMGAPAHVQPCSLMAGGLYVSLIEKKNYFILT